MKKFLVMYLDHCLLAFYTYMDYDDLCLFVTAYTGIECYVHYLGREDRLVVIVDSELNYLATITQAMY